MQTNYIIFVLALMFLVGVGFVDAASVYLNGNTGANIYLDTVTNSIGIGSSTPLATWQVTATTTNATSSLEIGKKGQNKGSCLKMYRYDGTAVYITVNNSNALVVSATTCVTGV